ncbi:response regulator [Chryseosolibacter indicus]|uniref:Response regulator n=1 Tax=Chryseosolibacter indicus TaxID=2782351 RepID=A0ABS5VLC7_9BACT|nr:response regulator [Chryseosolibacter indicus]MBT1702249.1 response regulator [Chryseosolibacter indicus]
MKEDLEIVLIEDNEDDAERLIKFLRSHVNNKIRYIQDGAEAVKFLLFESDGAPKLILLDLVLPSVDGFEVFDIIRSEPKERELSVIFLVSSLRSKEYVESLGVKPDGYLIKPKLEEGLPFRL